MREPLIELYDLSHDVITKFKKISIVETETFKPLCLTHIALSVIDSAAKETQNFFERRSLNAFVTGKVQG
jgi:hypothetical protein